MQWTFNSQQQQKKKKKKEIRERLVSYLQCIFLAVKKSSLSEARITQNLKFALKHWPCTELYCVISFFKKPLHCML